MRRKLFMNFTRDLAKLSKCEQRQVAAVITDKEITQVYSIGLNGGPSKGLDCLCMLPGKETCIHAETQAIAKSITNDKEKVMFITLSPCVTCASLIVNSGFVKVYYNKIWRDTAGFDILKSAGIMVEYLGND